MLKFEIDSQLVIHDRLIAMNGVPETSIVFGSHSSGIETGLSRIAYRLV
jgi:hypothetical protein